MMTKYEPEIKDYLIREIELLPFNQCKVDILSKPDYNNPPMGCFSLDEDGNPVAQFYTEVIANTIRENGIKIVKQGGVQKFIQRVVRHECRHYMQYEYIEEHAVEYNKTLDIESKFQYGDGPLEKDAKDFANGIVNDLSELIEKFYSDDSTKTKEPEKVVEVQEAPNPVAPPSNTKKKKRKRK